MERWPQRNDDCMRERADYCGGRDYDEHACKRWPFCPTHAGTLSDARLNAYVAEYDALHGKTGDAR